METLHTMKFNRDMCLRVILGQLQEMVQQNEILIESIDGKHQLADDLDASAARPIEVLESSHLF